MVAVVSGSGLGLFGGTGAFGNPLIGRGGERVHVNTATGNLVVQGVDETLAARGLDIALVRTYNSQGLLDDDNQDNWRLGVHQSLINPTGTLNNQGSTVTKVFGDGRQVVYTYDDARQAYVSSEGEGAHDTLTNAGGTWTWQEGSGRNTETYNSDGRLLSSADQDDNVVSYEYDQQGLLRQIIDASGQVTDLDYSAGNLSQIRVTVPVVDGPSVTQTLTRYVYDEQDRLRQVVVDLTPTVAGAITTDLDDDDLVEGVQGQSYVTTYTYEGNTNLISSITQTDGSSVSFEYELIAGQQRVTSFTDAEGRTTTLEYSNVSSGFPANPDALTLEDTEETTTTHELDESELSSGGGSGGPTGTYGLLLPNLIPGAVGGWANAQLLPASLTTLTKFNRTGDGIAVRYAGGETGAEVYARFYNPVNETWSAETRLDDAGAWDHHNVVSVDLDDLGNAVVLLMPEGPTFLPSVHANVYDAGTGTWSGPIALTNPATTSTWPGSASVEMRNGRAVATWSETSVTTDAVTFHGAVFNGSTWSTPFSDAVAYTDHPPMSGIDDLGNAWVAWTEYTATPDEHDVDANAVSNAVRFNAATGTWGAVATLETGARTLALASDANGRAIRLSLSDTTLHAQRFNPATGTWGALVSLGQFAGSDHIQTLPDISFDTDGDAIVVWGRESTLEIRRLESDTGTWLEAESLDITDYAYDGEAIRAVSVSLFVDRVALSWVSAHDDQMRVFALHGESGSWTSPVEVASGNIAFPDYGEHGAVDVTLDDDGEYTVSWQTYTEDSIEVRARRFSMRSIDSGYRVPVGATWQSVTHALYGISSIDAANQLRAALNDPPLTAGTLLVGFPFDIEVAVVMDYGLNTNATDWAGASNSPVVQSYGDNQGALIGTLHADGTLTTYSRNAAGAVVSMRHHANAPVTPQWSQNFSYDADGFSGLPPGFAIHENGSLTVTTRDDISGGMYSAHSDRTYEFDDYMVFRAEVTTGASSEGRAFTFGAMSEHVARAHRVLFEEDSIYATYSDSGWWRERLGAANNNTTYVIELATHASGSTLYVYEKGTDRLNGYVHHSSFTDWADVNMYFETKGEIGAPISTMRLDNVSESTSLGQLVGGVIAAESAQDAVGYTRGWSTARPLDLSDDEAGRPNIAYDANGNGIAAWVQDEQVLTRRYDVATGRWGAPVVVHTGLQYRPAMALSLALDPDTGHAVLAWVQDDDIAYSVFASVLDPQSGQWSAAQGLEASSQPVGEWDLPSVSVAGNRAVVAWQQHNGTTNDIRAARFNGTSWSAASVVDNSTENTMQQQVALDAAGNATFVWREWDAQSGGHRIMFNRWIQATQSYSGAQVLDAAASGERFPLIELDGEGNAFVLWSMQVKRFDVASGLWGPTVDVSTGGPETRRGWDLAVDEQGNALVTWVEGTGVGNVVYARMFDAASQIWSEAQALETLSELVDTDSNSTQADLRNGHAVVGWVQSHDARHSVYATQLTAGVWSTPALLETRYETPAELSVAVDAAGNAAVLWDQADGAAHTIYESRFNVGPPQAYVVPSGATWQSIADTLYDVDSVEAGNALRIALGNPTLTPGIRLVELPATLVVSGGGVPGEDYFAVPSGATWQSIAATLYNVNSLEAGEALRVAMDDVPLTAGAHLINLPEELAVTIDTSLAPYYTVQASDNWADVALALYGSDDQVVIDALRAIVDPQGTLQLAAGLRITPPLLLETPGGPINYFATDVENDLGQVTTYRRDSQGRLTAVLSPSLGGVRLETHYAYDTDGNVTSITEDPYGASRVTTFDYDEDGNQELSRDALGNTVTRTYDSNNQLITETRYLVADPDGEGGVPPSSPLTTRFVYDADNHLRFTISAEGRVTERRYDQNGQLESTFVFTNALLESGSYTLTELEDFADEQNLRELERVDYAYDFRGNLERTTSWAATDETGEGAGTPSITQYVYDQRGRLLQTIEARGAAVTPNASNNALEYATTYLYDGLGRVRISTQWSSSNSVTGLTTTYTEYDDANRRTVTTLANGLVSTSVYNTAGELIDVIQGESGEFGRTTYTYDDAGRLRMTTDPTEVLHFYYYDDAGRKIAEVDGDGTLTEFVFDRTSQLVKTIQYSQVIDTSTLVSGAMVPLDRTISQLQTAAGGISSNNRIARNVYDDAGRLAYALDPSGGVTHFVYDGSGRLTEEVRYADRVIVSMLVDRLTVAQFSPGGDYAPDPSPLQDRVTRHFYDGDGNRIGTLDAEGYLVELEYDSAGRLVHQIGYATIVPEANRGLATLGEVRPPLELDENTWIEDVHTYFYYDGQGRLVGVLDGKGYLTETQYDEAGHVTRTARYSHQVGHEGAFADIVEAASGYWQEYGYGGVYGHTWIPYESQFREYAYDGAGRVISEIDHEQTTARYEYNVVGQVERTTRATDYTIEPRRTRARYDDMGRVLQELSPEGVAQLEGSEWGNEQIEEIWNNYGVRYEYDHAGRRVSATTQPNGEQTVTTWFYYNDDGSKRFDVNSRGERREYRYNAFGQLEHELAYHDRLTDDPEFVFEDLRGGLLDQSDLELLTWGESANRFDRTTYTYTATGQVASKVTAAGSSISYSYNAFGEVQGSMQAVDAARNLEHIYEYDRRGLLTETRWDPTGINTTEERQYDAFGRLTDVTDARLNTAHFEYNTLHQQTAAIDAGGARVYTNHDAFSRISAVVPAAVPNVDSSVGVTYTYGSRSVATRYAGEDVSIAYRNAHGETSSVTRFFDEFTSTVQGYEYDANGNLITLSDELGQIEENEYDSAGRRTRMENASGASTWFRYDEANRVIRQLVETVAGSTQLETEYEYDALGRLTTVTEPNGRVTVTGYDGDGRVTSITINPEGNDPIRTEFQYDLAGNLTLKTEDALGAARRTRYDYDVLGRMTVMVVDPTDEITTDDPELNLVTQYFYDDNGNLTHEINPEEHSTWYVYDANNRVVQTIDALGGVTGTFYNAEGQVIERRRYANAVVTSGFQHEAPLQVHAEIASDRDRVTRSFYDQNGHEMYTLDGLGGVTERRYDVQGNVTMERVFSRPIPSTTPIQNLADVYYALQAAGNRMEAPHESTYDTEGEWGDFQDRIRWMEYDTRGRLRFTMDFGGALTERVYDNAGNIVATHVFNWPMQQATGGFIDRLADFAAVYASYPDNRITRFWYDGVGRVRFSLDAEGYLRETQYDDVNRTETARVYAADASAASPDFAAADLAELEEIALGLAGNAHNQVTVKQFDIAGRLESITHADGSDEVFTYDGLGNRRTYRNQAESVWTYDYDANGRLIEERSPAVEVTVVSANGDGLQLESLVESAIVTRMTYDSLGNVTTRTEGIWFDGAIEVDDNARTTTYEYDVLGRQIVTIHPVVSVYSGSVSDAANVDPALMFQETEEQPRSTVTYNTLGDAVVNVDVGGGVSRKAYDKLGRVQFEVDALGFVTEYAYDLFGNRTGITRIASALPDATTPEPVEWTAAEIAADLLPIRSAADRTITMEYDRLNRQTLVLQPSTFVYTTSTSGAGAGTENIRAATRYTYNAFGEVTRQRVVLGPVGANYADTHFFYDLNGRVRYEVNPENFVTRTDYDATGNVVRQVEFARRIATVSAAAAAAAQPTTPQPPAPQDENGYDRDTEFVYDVMGRLIEQKVHNVEYMNFSVSTTVPQYGTQHTTFGYDAVGNRTRMTNYRVANSTNALDAIHTYTNFDALGRIESIAQPERLADPQQDQNFDTAAVIPFVEMRRDVYGNLVQEIRYRNTAAGSNGEFSAPVAHAEDRSSLILVDAYGRMKRTQDATGAVRNASYTVRGELAKEWQAVENADGTTETLVTIRNYDLLGRETTTITPMQLANPTTTTVGANIVESMRYYQVAGGAPLEWVGTNSIDLYWPELAGVDVSVEIYYRRWSWNPTLMQQEQGEDYLRIEHLDNVRGGENISWTESPSLTDAGVHSIRHIIVKAQGTSTVIYDSRDPAPGPSVFYRQTSYTQVKYNAFGEVTDKVVNGAAQNMNGAFERQEYFEYDNAGRVTRTNTGDGVDKLYFYDMAGRTTLELRSLELGFIASLEAGDELATVALTNENVMRTEMVYNKLNQITAQSTTEFTPAGAVAPINNSVTALRVDNERLESTTFEGQPYPYYRWVGQNDIDLTWADLGDVPVQITVNYTTMPGSHWGFNSPQSTTASYIVEDAHAGSGYRFQFQTPYRLGDWVIEQGIATSPAGVNVITSVSVMGLDANNEYTVLLRGLGVPGGPAGNAPTVTPTVHQELDRWGNVIKFTDAAENVTEYRYNVLGGLVEKILPEVRVLDTREYDGNNRFESEFETPTQRNYFDILGRAIGSRDANGNLSRVEFNDASQVTRQIHANGGERTFVYDTFGNQVQATNERGRLTRTLYDEANRATTQLTEYTRDSSNEPVFLTRNFEYDEAGRRISETNGETLANSTAAETTKYFYDLLGNMVERRTAMGRRSVFEYDARGRKVFERNGAADEMTWEHDDFGRVVSHADMSGAVTNYEYNGAGLLAEQSRIDGLVNTPDQMITYHYDEAGHLVLIDDDGVNRTTRYGYDEAGRRSEERTNIDGRTHQDLVIDYDSHNRIRQLTDLRYSVLYSYDAQGNRTLIEADYRDTSNQLQPQDLWYTYDEMNRVELSQGTRTGNQLGITNQRGILLTYYLDGQRHTAEQYGSGMLYTHHMQDQFDPGIVTTTYHTGSGQYTETYEYDGAQRLTSVSRTGEEVTFSGGVPVLTTAFDSVVSTREYDDASRLEIEYWHWVDDPKATRYTYDDDGRLEVQTSYQYANLNSTRETQANFYYSGADTLLSYQVTAYESDGQTVEYTTHYYNGYTRADTYLLSTESAQTQQPNEPTATGWVNRTYNANRELVSAVDNNDPTKNRYFANNADGQAITVVQGNLPSSLDQHAAFATALAGMPQTTSSAHHFYFANGQNVGSVGRLQSSGTPGQARANFDVNYTPLDQLVASVPRQVVVQEGDTLRSIAARIYGDEGLWYLIAEENGESNPDAALEVGRLLTIPNQVVSMSNNASSFKPFNISEAIGDVTPTQAMPPPPIPKNGCGIIGMLITMVVVLVVSYYLGPVIGEAIGKALAGVAVNTTYAAGASLATVYTAGVVGYTAGYAVGVGLAAGLGSALGQGIAVAVGAQDKIDWKSVAATALTAGLMEGLGVNGMFGENPSTGQMLIKGATGSAVNQGVNIALGLQEKFSWREMAISSVSSAFAGEVSQRVDGRVNKAVVGSLTSVSVRRAMGGQIEVGAVVADLFANVIGNSVVDIIESNQLARQLEMQDARKRVIDRMWAAQGQNPDTQVDALDEIRSNSDFQKALSKLPKDVTILHDTAIWSILEANEQGRGLTLSFGTGRSFGWVDETVKVTFGQEETAQLAEFLERSQAITGGENWLSESSTALLVRSGASTQVVDETVRNALGKFVTDEDLSSLRSPLSISGDVIGRSDALNLSPLTDLVIERFNLAIFKDPRTLQAMANVASASPTIFVQEHHWGGGMASHKERATRDFNRITGDIREELVDAGFLPANRVLRERLETVYTIIEAGLTALVPVEQAAVSVARLAGRIGRQVFGAIKSVVMPARALEHETVAANFFDLLHDTSRGFLRSAETGKANLRELLGIARAEAQLGGRAVRAPDSGYDFMLNGEKIQLKGPFFQGSILDAKALSHIDQLKAIDNSISGARLNTAYDKLVIDPLGLSSENYTLLLTRIKEAQLPKEYVILRPPTN